MPCARNFALPGAPRRRGENLDERPADDFPFALRIGHALEPPQKQFRGVFVLQFDFEMPPENLAHDFRLAPAQHAVVDENAGELVADGLVNQRRRDARIHPAAQAQNDLFLADLGADLVDGLFDVIAASSSACRSRKSGGQNWR